MSWKFWEKKAETGGQTEAHKEKLPKPTSLPPQVGQFLVVNLGQNPDWTWNLKAVMCPQAEKHRYTVRVFSEGKVGEKGVRVKDYTSLDGHPDLILFEGWFDKKTNIVQMQKGPVPSPKAA